MKLCCKLEARPSRSLSSSTVNNVDLVSPFFPLPIASQLVAVSLEVVPYILFSAGTSQLILYDFMCVCFSECKCASVDLVFVVDSSESIGSTNFALAKDFIIAVIGRLIKDHQVKVTPLTTHLQILRHKEKQLLNPPKNQLGSETVAGVKYFQNKRTSPLIPSKICPISVGFAFRIK